MRPIEANIISSFQKVRADIESLQHQLLGMHQRLEDVEKALVKKEKKTAKKK